MASVARWAEKQLVDVVVHAGGVDLGEAGGLLLAHSSPWNSSRTGPAQIVSAFSSAPSLSAFSLHSPPPGKTGTHRRHLPRSTPCSSCAAWLVRWWCEEREIVVLRAPAVTPSTSASHSTAQLSRCMYREQPEQPALTSAGHVDVHSLGCHAVHRAQHVYRGWRRIRGGHGDIVPPRLGDRVLWGGRGGRQHCRTACRRLPAVLLPQSVVLIAVMCLLRRA